jgi:hypothetical protein
MQFPNLRSLSVALVIGLVVSAADAASSERVRERLQAAIDRYEEGKERREQRLRQDFDNARRALSRVRGMHEVMKVRALSILETEEDWFDADGKLPLSEAMRTATARYLAEENKARRALAKAYDAAVKQSLRNDPDRAEELVDERDEKLEPFVVCTWRYTWAHGRTNVYQLLSDGTFGGKAGFQWRLAGDRIVMRGRDYVHLKGGQWVDTCRLSPDGSMMDGKNHIGHQKYGVRIDG